VLEIFTKNLFRRGKLPKKWFFPLHCLWQKTKETLKMWQFPDCMWKEPWIAGDSLVGPMIRAVKGDHLYIPFKRYTIF
jgi:hypothetical protein